MYNNRKSRYKSKRVLALVLVLLFLVSSLGMNAIADDNETEGGNAALQPPHVHTAGEPVKESVVEASCKAAGSYDNVIYCTSCGIELSRESVSVPELPHTSGAAVSENEVPATCEGPGSHDEVVYCAICGAEISRQTIEDPAPGHKPGEAVSVPDIPTTCETPGSHYEVISCTVCGEELSREIKSDPIPGHTPGAIVQENAAAATCSAQGRHDEVVYCTVCNAELSRSTVTDEGPLAEHIWNEGAVTKEPTKYAEGEKTFICQSCGMTKTEAIPKLAAVKVVFTGTVPGVSAQIEVFPVPTEAVPAPAAIQAESDGSWLLLPGEYVYSVTAEGYEKIEKAPLKVTTPENGAPITVSLLLKKADDKEVPMPAFGPESVTLDGVTVTVSAPAGVFPQGAVLHVKKVPVAKEAEVEDAVDAVRDDNVNVAFSYTFDIEVTDAQNHKIQPADGSKVTVSFALAVVAEQNLDTSVYHVSEDTATGEMEAEELAVTEVTGANPAAIVETGGFSYYTVEFTYNNLEYVLSGNASTALSEILNKVGLSGTATYVESSNPSLFSAEPAGDGDWVVTAHQPFTSTEMLKVTIQNVVYDITVTDDIAYISYTVTFKVKNGQWDEGGNEDQKVTLSRREDEDLVLILKESDIPKVGSKPDAGYKAGSWDATPSTDQVISSDRIFTYTYEPEQYTEVSTWAELKNAIENNPTPVFIRIIKDIKEDVTETISIGGKTVTIDLNGKTINLQNLATGFIVGADDSCLILKDTAGGGRISIVKGSCITVDKGSLIMNGGELAGPATSDGNGYSVKVSAGTFTMNAGTITGNESGDGGVLVSQGAAFNLHGGTISGYNAVYNSGTFTMTGGLISGTSTGVYMNGGSIFQLSGGNVSGDTPVNCLYGSTFMLAGGPVISGSEAGVSLDFYQVITITDRLTNKVPISISTYETPTADTPVVFTKNLKGKGTAANFASSDKKYDVVLDENGEAALAVAYSVTCKALHGKVTASKDAAAKGTTITLTLTPDAHYVLDTLAVIDAAGKAVTVTDNSFIMPAGDVSVEATFKPELFIVSFQDTDGKILQSEELVYGSVPTYKGKAPTRADDEKYTYTWSGWTDGTKNYKTTDTLPEVTKAMAYTATYTSSIYYKAVDDEGKEYKQGSDGTLTFVFKRSEHDEDAISHFTGLKYDGRLLTRDKHYTASAGSVIIELQNSFLRSLSAGDHTLTAMFNDGNDVEVTFKVLKAETYTVKFNNNGIGTALASQKVVSGSKATRPADPKASGYTFKDWYTEKECENVFDFNTPITEDITLYAKWTKTSSGGGSGGSGSSGRSVPSTGDPNDTGLWAALVALSILVLGGAVVRFRKRRTR